MLERTIELIEKFVSLKRFQIEVDNNHHFINEAITFLENKILGELETDKARQEEIAKNKERIRLKQEKRKKEAMIRNEV